MSQIEGDAQPFVKSMIMGQRVTLDAAAQKKVATWIALRALVLRHTDKPVVPADKEWRDHFYNHRSPPDTCYQWIIAYDGSQPFWYSGHDITATLEGNPIHPDNTPHGILMTFAVGYFAMKVLWIRVGEPGQADPPGLLRVWPPSPAPVLWPQKILNDEGLLQLMAWYLV
jgi:hypothetical protein